MVKSAMRQYKQEQADDKERQIQRPKIYTLLTSQSVKTDFSFSSQSLSHTFINYPFVFYEISRIIKR